MSSISSVQAGTSAQTSALASRPPVVAAQAQQRQGPGGSAEVVAEKISHSRSVAAPSVMSRLRLRVSRLKRLQRRFAVSPPR